MFTSPTIGNNLPEGRIKNLLFRDPRKVEK
jgi:hypothetical protein